MIYNYYEFYCIINEDVNDASAFITNLFNKGEEYINAFIKNLFKHSNRQFVAASIAALIALGISVDEIYKISGGVTKEKQDIVKTVKPVKIPIKINKTYRGDFNDYMDALGFKESGNDYTKINTLGYIGRFQFGTAALKDMGIHDKINLKNFRKNPKIWKPDNQNMIMKKYTKINAQRLNHYLKNIDKDINDYEGKVINGIEISKSGLLAACHLVGARKVFRFLKSNGKERFEDAYGTELTDYLRDFGGYKINI